MNRLLAGELQSFNRLANGPVSTYTNLTADGAVSPTPAITYGYIVTTALGAGVITVYDNASAASGTVLFIIPASTAVGVYQLPVGVLAVSGLFADFASTGTVNFLFARS